MLENSSIYQKRFSTKFELPPGRLKRQGSKSRAIVASRELQLAIELCRFSRRRSRPTFAQLGRMVELRTEYNAIAEEHSLPTDVNYQPVDAGGVSAEWISGPNVRDGLVMLYLHGGCYATGSVETHRDLMTRLSIAASMRVLGLNYRLAPAHPFPAAIEDASAAYRWLLELGHQPSQIAIVGDSAGAGLALAAMITIRDEGLPLPACVACLSPWVDLALTGASMESKSDEDPIVSRGMLLGWGKLYLGESDPTTPLASPLYADLRGLPPMLIQIGSAEVLLDDATRLAERALAAGVDTTLEIWPEMIHVWQSFAPILPEGRQAIERVGQFVRTRLVD
jgi:epsilon-lactone hydrolase